MATGSYHCVQCARSLPSRYVVGFNSRAVSARGPLPEWLQGTFVRPDAKGPGKHLKKDLWRVRSSAERQDDSSPSLAELKLSLKVLNKPYVFQKKHEIFNYVAI